MLMAKEEAEMVEFDSIFAITGDIGIKGLQTKLPEDEVRRNTRLYNNLPLPLNWHLPWN